MSRTRDEKLEESLGHDNAKIRKAEMFRRCLSDKGFERYVANFYEKVEDVSPDVRSSFGEAPIDASGRYWKNGEKVTILVQCRHGGGATDAEGRRYVEKHEIEEFFGHVSHVRKNAGHDVHLICVTSVWFSKEARDFCHSKRIAALDFSGLLSMDQAYPLERFIKEVAERGELAECFSMFWLAKYLPEYARTETAVRRTRAESKSRLGDLMAEVESAVVETYANPLDAAPEEVASLSTILDVEPKKTSEELDAPATIFTHPKTSGNVRRSRTRTVGIGLALASLAIWVATSNSSEAPAPLQTSAVESANHAK